MPELPEVETIRRSLEPELVDRVLRNIRIHKADIALPPTDPEQLTGLRGRRIERVERRAKYLLFRLDRGLVLQTQLRMTGRFAIGRSLPDVCEFKHIAAEFELDDDRTLFYDDVRRLGGFRLLSTSAWASEERRLGPEPLEPSFTPAVLSEGVARSRAPIKNWLLDQKRLAGVGNIYASEALFLAELDPRRTGRSLDRAEVERLHSAIRETLLGALADSGTTLRDFRSINGRSGRYQNRLRVYGRDGASCRRCSAPVERIVQAGRSTFFCPSCQR